MHLKQELADARRRFDLLSCLRWRQPSSRLERSIRLSEIKTRISPAKALRDKAITLPALGKERNLPLRRNSHARA
jgi:hypothetical protein